MSGFIEQVELDSGRMDIYKSVPVEAQFIDLYVAHEKTFEAVSKQKLQLELKEQSSEKKSAGKTETNK